MKAIIAQMSDVDGALEGEPGRQAIFVSEKSLFHCSNNWSYINCWEVIYEGCENHRGTWQTIFKRLLSVSASLHVSKQSDDSSSSICDRHMPKNHAASKYQSDSDDTNQTKRLASCFSNSNNASNIESDSVNENFVPRVNPRRKRKFKKIAIDPDSNPSTSQAVAMSATLVNKMRILRSDCKNKYGTIWWYTFVIAIQVLHCNN